MDVFHSSPMITAFIVNALLGCVLGVAGGMLGIGGGLIAIPALAYLYGMEQHLAQGTALVMIAPNVMMGFLRYHQRHRLALKPVIGMSALAMLSTFVAARAAISISSHALQLGFATFLIMLALYFAWEWRRRARRPVERPVSVGAMAVLGIASGIMSGLFAIGGGLVVVPALVTLYGVVQTRAQGIALALVVPGATIALCTYAHQGQVDWHIGVPMALGGLCTISYGVGLAHRFSAPVLRGAFCVVLLATGVGMLLA